MIRSALPASLFALTAFLAAQQQPAGAPGPAGRQMASVKSDCAVDGYVVNAISNEPVPRVHITLSGANGQSFLAADNSGHWSFSNVSCGTIQLTASRPGFLNSPLVLKSGSPAHDVRIQIVPASVITGKVIDDQGDPVMGAQLTVLVSRVAEGRRSLVVTGNSSSNDLGEFRLPGLNAGRYIVCARSNERNLGDATTSGESCYPGPADGGVASTLSLAAGSEVRMDFTLHEVPTVHVRGVISGMPKNQGVGLTLVRREVTGSVASRQARISPDGNFDVAGVTPGSYFLSTDYFDSGTRLKARVPVEVGNADVVDVAVHLDSGFAVTGKVRIESKSGNALNRQFALSLRSAEPLAGGVIKWSADHSTFTISDLTPGNFRLEALPPAPFFVKSGMLAGHDILGEEVAITQAAGPIDIVLSDDGGALDAQVTGAGNLPVPSSWVMVLRDGGLPRNGMTGPDGHIKLEGLAPGDYRVYAWDDVQQVEYADPGWMQRHGSGASVSVQAGQTAKVTLQQQTVPAQ
jgi:hypothetical protein